MRAIRAIPSIWRLPLLVVGFGVAVSITVFFLVKAYDEKLISEHFENHADQYASYIQAEIVLHTQLLDNLVSFYEASERVERDEFRTFAASSLAAHSGLYVLAWLPRVSDAGRSEFEQEAIRLGVDGFHVTEVTGDLTIAAAARREEYYPILYREGQRSYPQLLGLDLWADPIIQPVLARARDSGGVVTSGLFAFPGADADPDMSLVVQPIYAKEADIETLELRRANIEGFIVAIFHMPAMIKHVVDKLPSENFIFVARDQLTLVDQTPVCCVHSDGEYSKSATDFFQLPLQKTIDLNMPGRPWFLTIIALPQFKTDQQLWNKWFVSLAIMVVVMIVAYMILHAARRNEETEEWARALQGINSELRDSEERLRAIATSAQDAIIMIDHRGMGTFWNHAAEKMFGFSEDEVIGKDIHQLLVPEHYHDDFVEKFPRFQETGKGEIIGTVRELTAKRKDSSEFQVEIAVSAVHSKGHWGAIAIVRDISERVLMSKKILQAEKLSSIGHLVGGITHELNNLLLPILSLTDRTLKGLPTDSRDHLRLEKVVTAAQRASSIVNQLANFSSWSELEQGLYKACDLMEEALPLIRTALPTTITFNTTVADIPDQVLIDPEQFHSALMNIADNAKDALEGKVGLVELTMDGVDLDEKAVLLLPPLEPGRYVRLAMRDNGHGMDEETADKVFDPFFTTKEVGQGTGLGLSVTHGIVSGLGGTISVESEIGKGTEVAIYLPVSSDEGV